MRQYIKAHDGLLLANHGALTVGPDVYSAYFKMETVEHFAKISLVARLLGGERLISQEEVIRLQNLRGAYGIASPAPICLDDVDAVRSAGDGCDLPGGSIARRAGAASRPGSVERPRVRAPHRERQRAP